MRSQIGAPSLSGMGGVGGYTEAAHAACRDRKPWAGQPPTWLSKGAVLSSDPGGDAVLRMAAFTVAHALTIICALLGIG